MREQGNDMMMYVLYFNKTEIRADLGAFMEPLPKDPKLIKLQESIDNAILKMKHDGEGEPPRIESTYSDWPEPQNRMLKDMDATNFLGHFFVALMPIFTFILFMRLMSREKQHKIRCNLINIGVSKCSYWLSWLLVMTTFNALQSAIYTLSGYLFCYGMWINVPWALNYWIYFIYQQAMIMYCLIVLTFMPDVFNMRMFCTIFTFFHVLYGMILSQPSFALRAYYQEHSLYHAFEMVFKELFPTFNFCMGFGLVSMFSANSFNIDSLRWTPAEQPYTWEMYHESYVWEYEEGSYQLEIPAPSHFINTMVIMIPLAFIAFFYIEDIMPNNMGNIRGFFYFCSCDYWK